MGGEAGEGPLPLRTVDLPRFKPPVTPEELASTIAAHRLFHARGGWGGTWRRLEVSGLVLGVLERTGCPVVPEGRLADLSRRNLDEVQLDGLYLPFANLVGTWARHRSARDLDLRFALVTDADWSGTAFAGADLTGCDFSSTRLRGCDFRGAHLGRVDLEHADLTGAVFGGGLSYNRWRGACLDGVRGLPSAELERIRREVGG